MPWPGIVRAVSAGTWYVKTGRTAVNWGTDVSGGVAQVDIAKLVVGTVNEQWFLFARAGQAVTTDQVTAAQAETTGGSVPAALIPSNGVAPGGIPLATSGLANGSVTLAKLATEVKTAYAPVLDGNGNGVSRAGLWLDLRDYVQAGDGTNYRPALSRALSAAGTTSGATIYCPPGSYSVTLTTTTLLVPANTTLLGVPGKTTFNLDTDSVGAYREMFRNVGGNVAIEGITFNRVNDFPMVMFPVQAYVGYRFTRCTLNGNRDIYATNYCHGWQVGVQSGTTDRLVVDQCTVTKLSYGLFQANASTGTTTNVRVVNSWFSGNYATDLEFNNPLGTMSGVRVVDCSFMNNQGNGTGGGFAVGFAFVSDAHVRGCTISGYANEAIHIEDYSSDITIQANSITNCGTSFTGVIQVISGANRVKILDNRISTLGNATSVAIINLLAGGSGTTPGGRTVVAPSLVIVRGNQIDSGGTTKGLYAESVLYLTIADNHFFGPGNVSSGSYGGPFCFALQIYTGAHTIITGNIISGYTYGIVPMSSTIAAFGAGSVIANNIFRRCLIGLPLIAADSCTATGNQFHICQSSMVLSQGATAPNSVVVTGNNAVGCTKPMSIYGTAQVTTTAAVTSTGAGKTVSVSALANTLPIGTVIYFTGGGVLTATAVANFDGSSVVGTLATATVASGETGVAYFPYSSTATRNRTIANNSDDYYGAAGYGVKIATASTNYRVLGHEGLILATAGGITITLPPAANHSGQSVALKNTAGTSITLAAVAGNVDGAATATLNAAGAATAVSDGTNWWLAA